jgi:hypothetical protein
MFETSKKVEVLVPSGRGYFAGIVPLRVTKRVVHGTDGRTDFLPSTGSKKDTREIPQVTTPSALL